MRAPTTSAASELHSAASSGLDIRFQELPPVELPADTDGPDDFISLHIENHKPCARAAVASLSSSTHVAALVLDFFATILIDIARELGIPPFVYFSSTAAMLALMLHLPTLAEKSPVSFEEMGGDVYVPGVSLVPPQAMPTPLMKRKNRNYDWFVYHGRRFLETKGIIINTFAELEGRSRPSRKASVPPGRPVPPLCPIRPILALREDTSRTGGEKHPCIRWLDGQPPASMVFLCFGSMGSFGVAQVREIAVGLERRGRRFLWCLRKPSAGKTRVPVDATPEEPLPEGFAERTGGRGMVWPSWAASGS